MNYYTVGWHGYEDSERIVLEHDNTFSQEDFTQLVEDAAVKVAAAFAPLNHTYTIPHTTYEDIFDVVISYLTQQGFRRLNYQAEHYTFSGGSLFDPEFGDWHRGDELNRITARLNEMGYGPEYDPRWVKAQEYLKKCAENP